MTCMSSHSNQICPCCLWSAISDMQADVAAIRIAAVGNTDRLIAIEQEMIAMGAREDQAYANLNANIQTVKDGWASLTAERDALRQALSEADAAKVAAVDEALAADSEVDASKVEAADAALAELVAQPGHDDQPTDQPVDQPVEGDPNA